VLAVVRPDSWNFPLLLHVLGAMLLVGSLVFVSVTLLAAWRTGSPALARAGANVLLLGVFPSFLLMRLAAEWIVSKEHLNDLDPKPDWLNIGFTTSDMGALLIIVSMVAAGLTVRRLNRGADRAGAGARVIAVLASILLVAYLVTVWAMTTKPT
jgi:uncharacterized membrane protein